MLTTRPSWTLARRLSRRLPCRLVLAGLALALSACTHPSATGLRGRLLVIGGALKETNDDVYRRFAELARRPGSPHVVVATAASADEDAAAKGKPEFFASKCPGATVDVVRRTSNTQETVAAFDRATAVFFTGGDQKRITERYRPGDRDTPESLALSRVLTRGGVVAGTSAGDAMMGDIMFLGGGSAEALGYRATKPSVPADDESPAPTNPAPAGPRLGPGMKLVPWIITDSHFFERDRVGRLVAALEATGRRLGLGVSENACVEIDLASGDLVGISAAESLLVDAGSLRRDGPARRDISARVIGMGDRLSLTGLLATPAPRTASRPSTTPLSVPDSSESRGAARSAALFTHAARRSAGVTAIHLEGWAMTAWPDGNGGVTFDIEP